MRSRTTADRSAFLEVVRPFCALILVACSTGTNVGTDHGARPADAARRAAHGGAIQRLAITDDGTAVVTQDSFGATRLWPTLDGTREPLVVPAVRGELAIGRDRQGFTIAVLDEVGGVELVRVTAQGHVRARHQLAADPAFVQLAIAGDEVFGLRADQTIAVLDDDGESLGQLSPPPGERLERIVTRHGRVLALLSRPGAVYGRWIVARHWAGTTRPLTIIDPHEPAMLSPDGINLAVARGVSLDVFDLATGSQGTGAGEPFGYLDADTLAVVDGQLKLQGPGGAHARDHLANHFVVGDGIAVGAFGGALELHRTMSVPRYLGYRFAATTTLHESRGELLAIDRHQAIALDGSLHATLRTPLPDDPRDLADVVPLDSHHVIAAHQVANTFGVSVIDTFQRRTVQAMSTSPVRGELRYEPATDLLALTDNTASFVTRLNRDSMKFETWYRIGGNPRDVYVLDPGVTGLVAIAAHHVTDAIEIEEIDAAALRVGEPVTPRHTYRVPGERVATVDRQGRVYVVSRGDVTIYEHGTLRSTLAGASGGVIVPSPDGSRIVVRDQRLRMYDAKQALRWTIAAPLVTGVTWHGDRLVANAYTSAVELDVETGAIKQRACGWGFSLDALPPRENPEHESMCD